jgi:hypothetical protein
MVYLRRRKLLFKTNKTRNINIKNSNNRRGRDDRYWPSLACGGVDRGDGWYNILKDGRKWSKLLHMAEKHKEE